MKTVPIVPAQLEFNAQGLPYSAAYGDVYHPLAGAYAQAQHVFLAGNGLPQRWSGRDRFVVLECGFGLGNNFLAVWDAWRRDPERCAQLHFISIERHPLTRADLARAHEVSPVPDLARALINAWPPLTPNLHRLVFDEGRLQLLLALGDVADQLKEIVAQVDAFFLDGFAPAKNPQMWQARLFKSLARLAAPNATLATWSAARAVRDGLTTAGFEVCLAAGSGGKRDITLARFAPRFAPQRVPVRGAARAITERRVLIVGGGLAGCAAAWALAEQGWRSVVFDRHAAPAQEASGNPAGLFHGIVNPQDGAHARFNRAAALEAQRVVAKAIADHGVAGSAKGLLRLNMATADVAAMQAALDRLALPSDYVQALDAKAAGKRCGLQLQHPAWFYPGGGWVDPAGLARACLERAEQQTRFAGGVVVNALRRSGSDWQLLNAQGQVIDEAETIVLANAGDALRLLGQSDWPIEALRGQISMLPAHHLALPRIPISGAGYLLPELNGRAWFGATSQAGDLDPAVRCADHVDNLARLATLRGAALDVAATELQGRTAWRWSSNDRLPVVGAVPEPGLANSASALRLDQPRFVPRQSGLFVFTALGSRGISWSTLGAQVLASSISGAPSPLEASLLDAIDPARFVTRAYRRRVAG